MSHDVFISYSDADQQAADAVRDALARRGLRCWSIAPGQERGDAIDGIKKADAFVLVFSARTNDAPHIRSEVEIAVDLRIPVLPFRVGEGQPSEALGYFLDTLQWIDARVPPFQDHLERLATSIHDLIRARQKRMLGKAVAGTALIAVTVAAGVGWGWFNPSTPDGASGAGVQASSSGVGVHASSGGAGVRASSSGAGQESPCYEIKGFGSECEGKRCEGDLHGTWNCDMKKQHRVRCKYGVVVADACNNSCRTMPGGQDDQCQ